VWTYDIYQSYIAPDKPDAHYLLVARLATVFGIGLSVATAYLAAAYNNIMDVLQLVFAFVNAPLFATFLLGMFWKRTTGHGAFWGLVLGTAAAAAHHGLTMPKGETSLAKGGWLGSVLHVYPSNMAQNFWTAIFAWSVCFIATIAISLATTKIKTDAQLKGLVWSLTPHEDREETSLPFWKRVGPFGAVVIVLTLLLNFIFR
jgi:SSS family solute:Na+ symporter